MNILRLYLIIFVANTESYRIIPRKLCKDCKYFIAHKKECALFGDTDLVNGKNNYYAAKTVRENENDCGENAKFFEENTNKIVTVPYYFILNLTGYWPYTPVAGLLLLYLYVIYNSVDAK
jgi:hypothetical protein